MVSCIDGAATVHLCANRPVLLEVGAVADDGRCVYALFLPDFVGCAVGLEGAVLCCAGVVGGVMVAHCNPMK